jgi:hypothetical protein
VYTLAEECYIVPRTEQEELGLQLQEGV